MNQQEKKFYEYTITMACPTPGMAASLLYATNTSTGGTVVPNPASIVQGTTANTRIGQKIFLHSINLVMNIYPTVAGITQGCSMRYGIYHNKEANGTQIAYTDIFNSGLATACRNLNKKPMCTVMKDLQAQAVVTGTDSTGVVKAVGPSSIMKLSVHPKKVINYSSGTATITDILKDDYGLFMCCTTSGTMNMFVAVQLVFSDA